MPLPITLAPDPVHLVSYVQHTSIFRLCSVSTTSAEMPVIIPVFQVASLIQSGTSEVFSLPHRLPCRASGLTFIMMETPSCSLAGFPIILFVIGRWSCPRGTTDCTPRISFEFHKMELVQSSVAGCPSYCQSAKYQSLDLIDSRTTKTPKQGKGAPLPLCRLSDASTPPHGMTHNSQIFHGDQTG